MKKQGLHQITRLKLTIADQAARGAAGTSLFSFSMAPHAAAAIQSNGRLSDPQINMMQRAKHNGLEPISAQ